MRDLSVQELSLLSWCRAVARRLGKWAMNLLSAARMKEWIGGELPALDIMVVQIDGLQHPLVLMEG